MLVFLLPLLLIIVFFFLLNVALLLPLFLLIFPCQLPINVLDLSPHCFIGRLHLVDEHVDHAKCVCLLFHRLAGQNRVKSPVYVRSHLQIVMFHHISEHLQNVDLLQKLLASIFSSSSQTKIHKQSRRIFSRIVRQVVLMSRQHLKSPSDDTSLYHSTLSLLSQTELLKSPQGILPKIRIFAAFSVESVN